MIQLTFVNDDGEALLASAAPFFRITGSAVWTVRGDGYIARLTGRGWESNGKLWTGLRFEGLCRLVMGFPREPSAVSEILQSVSVSLDVLSANGIPFAAYNPAQDMWRAAMDDRWWHAFRIESIDQQASISDATEPAGSSQPSGGSRASPRGERQN